MLTAGDAAPQGQVLPSRIRALVLDDERLRNDECWSVFEC
jgi:hypothetical protein